MAYEKQTWATGDVITESKLNHIEDGIANAGGKALSVSSFSIPAFTVKAGFSVYKSVSFSNPIKREKIKSIWFSGNPEVTCSAVLLEGNNIDAYQASFHCAFIKTETDTRSESYIAQLQMNILLEED